MESKIEDRSSIKVPGRHRLFTKKDYLVLERPAPDTAYTAQVRRYVKRDPCLELKEEEYDRQRELITQLALSEALLSIKKQHHELSRISTCFDNEFLEGKKLLVLENFRQRKLKKGGKKQVQLSSKELTLLEIYKRDHLIPHLESIDSFVDSVIRLKEKNLVRYQNKITIQSSSRRTKSLQITGKAELYYLVVILLLKSAEGGHTTVNDVIFHEIRIALQHLKTSFAFILLEKFNKFSSEEDEARDRLEKYPVGLFSPILKQDMLGRSHVEMLPYQKDFANKIKELIEDFVNCINGTKEWPGQPRALFNLNTFGSGKTTIGAIATAHCLEKGNSCLETGHLLIGLFILPSIQTSILFASIIAMDQPTWVIQRGVVMPIHKFCPQFYVRRGRKLFQKTERWADFQGTAKKDYRDGLNHGASLFEQVKLILNWTPEFVGDGKEYISGHKRFKKPVMIFADSESALELNIEMENFKSIGWHFLNILDEFPATADCNFMLHENELLQNVLKIIQCDNKFNILMSASPTEQQIRMSNLFQKWDCTFTDVCATTRSFTQLYTEDGRPIFPLQALDPSSFWIVNHWDDTDFRYFTPAVFILICDHLKSLGCSFDFNLSDVKNQDTFIEAIKRLCQHISLMDETVIQSVCNLQVSNVGFLSRDADTQASSSLTLTSGHLEKEVFSALDEKPSHLSVQRLFQDFTDRVDSEIQDLKDELSSCSRNKQKSTMGSKELLLQRIEDLEKEKNDPEKCCATITTNLGVAEVSYHWYLNYGSKLSDEHLAVILSGLDIEFENRHLTVAINKVSKKPRKIIDTITSMFGRNDHRIENVIIKDPNNMIGFDTLKQGLARAGRTGLVPVVSGIIDEHLLYLFRPGSKKSVPSMDNIASKTSVDLGNDLAERFRIVNANMLADVWIQENLASFEKSVHFRLTHEDRLCLSHGYQPNFNYSGIYSNKQSVKGNGKERQSDLDWRVRMPRLAAAINKFDPHLIAITENQPNQRELLEMHLSNKNFHWIYCSYTKVGDKNGQEEFQPGLAVGFDQQFFALVEHKEVFFGERNTLFVKLLLLDREKKEHCQDRMINEDQGLVLDVIVHHNPPIWCEGESRFNLFVKYLLDHPPEHFHLICGGFCRDTIRIGQQNYIQDGIDQLGLVNLAAYHPTYAPPYDGCFPRRTDYILLSRALANYQKPWIYPVIEPRFLKTSSHVWDGKRMRDEIIEKVGSDHALVGVEFCI
eukprot:CAMPEP_0117744382 /NCGR_PEP_ID=MMETSP0947-20121206/6721_1 /TAXON_ID=44440 /ORGANISM="Chattonella subsalsa, Strain CCMP2191" /LENGTH=1223 /DNA_ID=CAMNT_0005561311 /DNA_START=81 /DNA_END=3752 /DNA_ORIENTATION=+